MSWQNKDSIGPGSSGTSYFSHILQRVVSDHEAWQGYAQRSELNDLEVQARQDAVFLLIKAEDTYREFLSKASAAARETAQNTPRKLRSSAVARKLKDHQEIIFLYSEETVQHLKTLGLEESAAMALTEYAGNRAKRLYLERDNDNDVHTSELVILRPPLRTGSVPDCKAESFPENSPYLQAGIRLFQKSVGIPQGEVFDAAVKTALLGILNAKMAEAQALRASRSSWIGRVKQGRRDELYRNMNQEVAACCVDLGIFLREHDVPLDEMKRVVGNLVRIAGNIYSDTTTRSGGDQMDLLPMNAFPQILNAIIDGRDLRKEAAIQKK